MSKHINPSMRGGLMSKRITQRTLAAVLKQRAAIQKASTELDVLEESLLQRLKAGEPLQPGLIRAYVKEWERRSPAWKAVVEREISQEYAARVLAATKPDKFEKLVVEAGL